MNRLKQARIAKSEKDHKHISQKDVASKIGISQQAYARYESGDREPKLAMWQKLADYFEVSVSYLQGIIDTPVPETWAELLSGGINENYKSDTKKFFTKRLFELQRMFTLDNENIDVYKSLTDRQIYEINILVDRIMEYYAIGVKNNEQDVTSFVIERLDYFIKNLMSQNQHPFDKNNDDK